MRAGVAGLTAALVVGAIAREAAAQDRTLKVDLGAKVTLELILVPAGTQKHGSPVTEPDRGHDEGERDVTISKAFYLGQLPVTCGQFERFVAETGYRTEAEKGTSGGSGWDGKELVQKKEFTWKSPGFIQTPEHPVTLVTFDDSMAFASWASRKAERVVTLPTEAQWEHACRADTRSRWCGAEEEAQLAQVAWVKTNAGTYPAGMLKPNAWGLHEMSGSVWEWTLDWYGPAPAGGTDPVETDQNLGDKPRRVLKGGSWLKDAKNARAAMRYKNTPGSRNADNGFRVVAAVQPGGALPALPPGTPSSVAGPGVPLVIWGAFAGIAALVVFLFIRGVRAARREGAGGLAGHKTWSQGDGFFILAPNVTRGARVRYRCNVGGEVRTAALTYDASPKGQFVYTGGHPTNVVIEGVDAPRGAGWAAAGAATRDDDDDDHDIGSSGGSVGYPSAY